MRDDSLVTWTTAAISTLRWRDPYLTERIIQEFTEAVKQSVGATPLDGAPVSADYFVLPVIGGKFKVAYRKQKSGPAKVEAFAVGDRNLATWDQAQALVKKEAWASVPESASLPTI